MKKYFANPWVRALFDIIQAMNFCVLDIITKMRWMHVPTLWTFGYTNVLMGLYSIG